VKTSIEELMKVERERAVGPCSQ